MKFKRDIVIYGDSVVFKAGGEVCLVGDCRLKYGSSIFQTYEVSKTS